MLKIPIRKHYELVGTYEMLYEIQLLIFVVDEWMVENGFTCVYSVRVYRTHNLCVFSALLGS